MTDAAVLIRRLRAQLKDIEDELDVRNEHIRVLEEENRGLRNSLAILSPHPDAAKVGDFLDSPDAAPEQGTRP